jgi:hypothetical protein
MSVDLSGTIRAILMRPRPPISDSRYTPSKAWSGGTGRQPRCPHRAESPRLRTADASVQNICRRTGGVFRRRAQALAGVALTANSSVVM